MYTSPLRREALQRRFSRPSTSPESYVRQVEQSLCDPDPEIRLIAVQLLAKAGAHAIRSLTIAVSDEDATVRLKAVEALGQCPEAADVVPPLVQGLADSDAHVRMAAAKGLGSAGALARSAIPALICALADVNLIFSRLAAQALSRIGVAAVPALAEALRNHDGNVRREAAWALGSIGAPAADALPALQELLNGESTTPRSEPVGRSDPLAATCIVAIEVTRPESGTRRTHPERDTRVRIAAEQAIERIRRAS